MESEFTMKTLKRKHRKGYTLIEILVTLSIFFVSLTILPTSYQVNEHFILDAHVFANMMKAVALNKPIKIEYQNKELNTFHPTHAFGRSYTHQIGQIEIIFYIGRGYYAIKRRN